MSNDRLKRETMTIEEATVSNMWEIAAIIEMSKRHNALTRRLLWDQGSSDGHSV
jgi:hypothetical protein